MEGTTREGEDLVILLEVWWFVSACATLFSYIKEGRPLNSVYRSAFTYYIHRRSLNGIDKLSSPSPIMPQNSPWIWEKENPPPQLHQKGKGKENLAWSFFFYHTFLKEPPPGMRRLFHLQYTIYQWSSQKSVWLHGSLPLGACGAGLVLDMRIFAGWTV